MSQPKTIHLWVRNEPRPGEKRVALVPKDAKTLLDNGYKITVEKSVQRAFPIEDYEQVGCQIAESESWIDLDTRKEPSNETQFVLGLKELPEQNFVSGQRTVPHLLPQRHIYFAHCYKNQASWKHSMSRWVNTPEESGELLDLEFLQFDNGRRIAAFGFSAGFAGVAAGLLAWAHQKKSKPYTPLGALKPYRNKAELIEHISKELESTGLPKPKVLVLGALGRCGQGSVKMCELVGITPVMWDLNETKNGGPFYSLVEEVDILVNDIYLMGKIPPFVTKEMIAECDVKKSRQLTVFVDVSCDVSNPNNPFPLINDVTSLDQPTLRVVEETNDTKPLDVIAIDHLPTLIPYESSEDFSGLLVNHLKNLHTVNFEGKPSTVVEVPVDSQTTENQRVWLRGRQLFNKKSQEYKSSQ